MPKVRHDYIMVYTTRARTPLHMHVGAFAGMELAFLIAQFLADQREEELSRESGVPPEMFIASTDKMSLPGPMTVLAPGRGI